ncbi:MAG: hypothetical protein WBC51_00085 [Vicinamibacterales bacterium]
MTQTVEISSRGRWMTVPAAEFDGHILAVKGRWIRIAVIREEDYTESDIVDPERYVQFLKQRAANGFRADIFTFAQKLPPANPRFSYAYEWESVAAARTSSFKAWWDALPQESRKNVRRAAKRGVTITVKQLDDQLIGDICELNNDSPMRQGRRFAHYGKTFEEVRKDQSHLLDRSDYICAYAGAELIGFLKVAYTGDVAAIVQILPKASHQDKRPANALLSKAVELCEARGAAYLTYGLFQEGNRRESPLRQFKARNGFEEVLVPRYYVPLSPWGTVCTRLKLYRGLIDFLPDRVIRLAVSARAKWYGVSQRPEVPV